MHDMEASIYNLINFAFTWVFLAESIIKLIGLGFKGFVRDRYNIFDSIIVFVCVAVEIYDLSSGNHNKRSIATFRVFRLFRTIKLIN